MAAGLTQSHSWQRPEVWQTPRPTRMCWIPLLRSGLETVTHSFILFLHNLCPGPLSWFKGSLWKGAPAEMTQEGSVCSISQKTRSAQGAQSYPSHKAQWSLLPTGQSISGKCCCSGGGWFCRVSTQTHFTGGSRKHSAPLPRISEHAQHWSLFFLPLIFMHYSHIIKKSCRTFNYLLHNYNHICISISRSPVS